MNLRLILLLIIGFLGQIAQAQFLQLQPLTPFGTNGDGSILPGQRPYLTDGSTNSGGVHELQRSMAYNPTTGHLLILSRTNLATTDRYYIAIIDAATGADVGSLSIGTPGVGGAANFDFNTIAIADDGGIYVCDQTSSSQTTGAFNLYYWASESGSMNYVWSGDPSSANTSGSNARWGDSMVVTGTGTDTRVLVSSRGNVVAILTPNDPTLTAPWACATILTTVPSGNIGYALAFGVSSNTFYAQAVNGPLYLFNYTWTNSLAQAQAPFPIMAGTATNVQTYAITNFPQWTGAIGIQSQSNLLAELEMPPGPPANVRLYGITNTAIPPVLLDRKAWVTNEAGNGVFAGSVIFANTNVYALNSDNGIMAYRVVSGPAPQIPPAVILSPISQTASLANNSAPFIGAADGSAPLAYQWYFSTNNLAIVNATNSRLTITNVQSANFGSYYFIVTNLNGYGSATSAVANLSEAVTFKNGVVYEPFNYPAGLPLQNLGGWVTNTASVAAQVQGCFMAAGSLSAPGLPASIGNHYLWASNVTVRLPFGSQTNGPIYFSFLHRGTNLTSNTSTEDPIGGLAYNSSTTLYPKIDCVWSDANHYTVGAAKGTGVGFRVTDTQVFTGTDTVFIVCCLVMTNGNTGADILQLWVNPNPATYGTAAPPPPNCVTNAGNGGASADPGATGVDRISWRGTASSFQHEVDEVRIGFTWAAVTPPTPVSLAVSASGNNVIVSWPTNAVGWTLTGTANLSSGPWATNTPIVVQGTNNTFTVSGATGQQFFRLTR